MAINKANSTSLLTLPFQDEVKNAFSLSHLAKGKGIWQYCLMKCQLEGCDNKLSGKQEKFCCVKCSILDAKRRYRKRKREKLNAYNREYRKQGVRHLTSDRRRKFLMVRGAECEQCGSHLDLQIHHIKPIRCGGKNIDRNLLILCRKHHMEWEKRMVDYWSN